MRVFLDANILFSGSFSDSHLARFLEALRRHASLVTNDYAKAEAERNLAAKDPGRAPSCKKFLGLMESVPLEIFDPGIGLAEKDLPILCGAISSKADFLLTGDKKHFGHLFGRKVRGVKIVNVEMFITELIERGMIEES